MKIEINFKHPYMDAKIIEELTIADLDCFYADADEVSSLNLFFILEASLHRLHGKENRKAAARCLVISNQGKHYKVHRLDNVGGFVTLAKTPSDNRSELNISRYIIQLIEA